MTEDEKYWAAVQADYEGRALTLEAVGMRHGLTIGQLAYAARNRGWARRYLKHLNLESSIKRMFRVLEVHLIRLEATEVTMKTDSTKEVGLLANMCKTLEKLIEIDNARPSQKRTGKHGKDMTDLTNQLVRRIEQLKRR